jgi:holo-[acyl-carrier protein] synthase
VIVGIGVDVIEVSRVKALLDGRGHRAGERLFSEEERRYCESKAMPERHFAARVAAKEAAFKALSGTDDARAIGWREIEVRIDRLGRPDLLFHGRAAARAAELAVTKCWVSLTHGDTIASAMVVLETRE